MTGWRQLPCLCVLALLSASLADTAGAATVTLKIRAINPNPVQAQKVPIRSVLPPQVTPEAIISAGDLDVSYDVAARAYVVGKEVELGPAETRTFEVVVNDVWEVPEARLAELASHAQKLCEALKGSDKAETAAGLKALIEEGLKGVQARQAAAAVGAVKPLDHIRVFEANQEVLERVRKDLGVLENLVIAAGHSPEAILGLPKVAPPVEYKVPGTTGAVMTLHIKITNPSATETRKVPLKHDLPAEVRTTDVVEDGGLRIGFDPDRNLCYAYQEDISLAPGESKVFDIKIRDPWSGLEERLPRLETRTRDILAITKDMETYKAVDAQARAILKDLEAVRARKGPGQVSPDYVAFSRRQADEARALEARIQRLEELFQPREKPIKAGIPVMDVPRPDKRTTWVLIYIILGFLGVFSALFFLRWYGKGKSEKMGEKKE